MADEPSQAETYMKDVVGDRWVSFSQSGELSLTPSSDVPQSDRLMTALREVVRTELKEAMDGVLKDMFPKLHDLSVALRMMCELSVKAWERAANDDDKSESVDRSTSTSEHGSVSGSGSRSGSSPSTPKGLPEAVHRALRIDIPTPRSAPAASSSATQPKAGRVLSPILSGSPSECSHSPHENSQGMSCRSKSRSAQFTPAEPLKDEEPESQAEVAGTSLVKELHPNPKSFLEGAGNIPIVAEGDEPVFNHDDENAENQRPGIDRSRAFSEFEKIKANACDRIPSSLSAMEDGCLLESMEKIRLKKKSKHRRHAGKHRDFTRVVPDKHQVPAPLEDVPEHQRNEFLPGSLQEIGHGAAKPDENMHKEARYTSDPHRGSDPTDRRLRTLDQLRSDHAQNIFDDYTGLKHSTPKSKQKSTASISSCVEHVCKSCLCISLKEFPEYCLAAFGITQLDDSFLSRFWVNGVALARTGAVIFIIVKESMRLAEASQTFYTSSVPALLALGTSVSMFCLRAGNSKAVLGGHCDAIQLYAADKYFLGAWRTRSFLYFCIVVATCVVQSVLFVHRVPGSVADECEDVGLGNFEPTMHVAHLLVVGTMAMLVFLHLRMCAGLQLMVDSFCEDFKMGMDDMRAASDWSTITGLMNKSTSTLGTSFLIQISAVAAALVNAAADVLVGNVGEGSLCSLPWLVHWVTPALLGLLLDFAALVQSGRLTLKCSSVAGFVNTVRYKECVKEDARDLRQYLVNFIHQSPSGFVIQGSHVTTFAVFKLGWCFLTAIFAVWARSRST